MTRIVVTGAGGYLGGAVTTAASTVGAVRAVLRREAPWLPGVPLVCDLLSDADAAVEGADAVVHLAGANEVVARRDPDQALAATTALARAVGEACRRQGVRRLVYVSTIHVYGSALAPGNTVTEDVIPAPRSVYSIARLACEHILASAVGDESLVVLRLSNAVGAPADVSVQRWTLLANDLCLRAARGLPLELRTPDQQRDFVGVSDVARIVTAACDPGLLDAGTYNLASGETMTVYEFARLVADQSEIEGLGRPQVVLPPTVTDVAPHQAGVPRYRIDAGRLTSFGLVALTPLAGAVAETLRLCREAAGKDEL